jgi:hypothetical protein
VPALPASDVRLKGSLHRRLVEKVARATRPSQYRQALSRTERLVHPAVLSTGAKAGPKRAGSTFPQLWTSMWRVEKSLQLPAFSLEIPHVFKR